MSDTIPPPQNQPLVYEIRVQGHLDERWTGWFGGMRVTREANGETVLTGPVVDQAALYGLLRRIRDLGLPLLSLTRVAADGPDTPERSA